MKHDDWDWSDPRTLLGVPSLPLSGGRCWPSASLLVGGQLAVVNHTWEARMWSATAGVQGTGAGCSRLSPPVLTEAGVTPAVHLRGPAPPAASPTQPVGEVW